MLDEGAEVESVYDDLRGDVHPIAESHECVALTSDHGGNGFSGLADELRARRVQVVTEVVVQNGLVSVPVRQQLGDMNGRHQQSDT